MIGGMGGEIGYVGIQWQVVDVGVDCQNFVGQFEVEIGWQCSLFWGQVLMLEYIFLVYVDCLDMYQDFFCGWCWGWQFFVFEDFWWVKLMKMDYLGYCKFLQCIMG